VAFHGDFGGAAGEGEYVAISTELAVTPGCAAAVDTNRYELA
jgi:hypothetical protein